MGMEQWTFPEDIIKDWIGDGKPVGEEVTIGRWIARAERLIRREFPAINARLESGDEPDLLDTLRDVTSSMVIRVLRNPEGYRQTSRTDGSFTGSVTFAGDTPGGLGLTQDERDSLKPPGSAGTGGAFSISIGGTDGVRHSLICSINFGAAYCSCGADLTLAGPLYGGDADVV